MFTHEVIGSFVCGLVFSCDACQVFLTLIIPYSNKPHKKKEAFPPATFGCLCVAAPDPAGFQRNETLNKPLQTLCSQGFEAFETLKLSL